MTEEEIHDLIGRGSLPDGRKVEKLVTTHISWVILTEDRVYKIKKPLKLSFLDFSTLEKRKHYVEQELILNQRLCKGVYLQALPTLRHAGALHIGGKEGEIVDYALEMKRLDNSREMDVLLAQGKVGEEDIDKVLHVLTDFHQNTDIIRGKLSAEVMYEDFADIEQITDFCSEKLGLDAAHELMNSISVVKKFLDEKSELILQRDKEGFTRDCHGDLHAGNIFLLDEPVLFDCIEFNEHFRQIDILNELAFFTMELEFAGRKDLSDYFMEGYNRIFPVMRSKEEEVLYLFYKLHRANVKVKVNALKTMQAEDPETVLTRLALFKEYFQLFRRYHMELANL